MTSSAVATRIDIQVSGAAPGAPLRLQGLLGQGRSGAAVVAHPHPLYGGEMSNPVVVAIADGLERAGIAALRFDFRGCGGSDGFPSADPAQADADLSAAFAALSARHPGPYLAAGYSFGAAAALRLITREPRVERVILVAPPLSMIDRGALRGHPTPITVFVGDDDAYAPIAEFERALAGRERTTLHVLAGEDHFWSGGTDLAALVASVAAERR